MKIRAYLTSAVNCGVLNKKVNKLHEDVEITEEQYQELKSNKKQFNFYCYCCCPGHEVAWELLEINQ